MNDRQRVILVSDTDQVLGSAGKLLAHRKGWLHRAVSVFLFDGAGRLLLQRRAEGKYHSGGRWSNTCCGHPRPNEGSLDAAHRRLREEMGLVVPLACLTSVTYRAEVGEGLVEHEYDHLFVGRYDGDPSPDPTEVAGWSWMELTMLLDDLEGRADRYTVWLRPTLAGLLRTAGAPIRM